MKNPSKTLESRGIILSDRDGIDLMIRMIEIKPEKRITI